MFWQRTEALRMASQMMFEQKYHRNVIPYVADALIECNMDGDETLANSILAQLSGDFESRVAKPFLYEFYDIVKTHYHPYEQQLLLSVGKLNHWQKSLARSVLGIGGYNFVFLWGIPIGCYMWQDQPMGPVSEKMLPYFLYKFQMFENFVYAIKRPVRDQEIRFDCSERTFSLLELKMLMDYLPKTMSGNLVIKRLVQDKPDNFSYNVKRENESGPIWCWKNDRDIKLLESEYSDFYSQNIHDLKPLGAY